jgi:hypothetical protein
MCFDLAAAGSHVSLLRSEVILDLSLIYKHLAPQERRRLSLCASSVFSVARW